MIVGFTGTRRGLTNYQRILLGETLRDLSPTEFHHGDCVGADDLAHTIVAGLPLECRIVIHPPINDVNRAWRTGHVLLPEKPYLKRNADIVDACDILIACPAEMSEVIKSGTWATIRRAKKSAKPTTIIWPQSST